MTRAAIYARVSGNRQEKEETIASQLDQLRSHVRERAWELDERHVFTDDGVTGSRLDRPGLDGLRDAAADGQIDKVVITCPDRLARCYPHQWVLMEELQKHGVEVEFLNRPIGATAEDQLLLNVQGAIAEYERAKILERTRRGRLYRARAGEMLNWSRAPFGYRYQKHPDRRGGTALIDESEAKWVRKIFEWVLVDGVATRVIAQRLTQAGVRPRVANHWYPSTVREMLKNPVYMGRAYYNRRELVRQTVDRGPGRPLGEKISVRFRPREEWIEIRVPAIVDEETFQRAQARLRLNKRESRRRTGPGRFLLRGLVHCTSCGGRMTGRGNHQYPSYSCVASTRPWDTASLWKCPQRGVRADFLDALVWKHLQNLLTNPGVLEAQLNLQKQSAGPPHITHDQQIIRLGRDIEAQNRRMERLLDLYQDGAIEKDAYKERQQALQDKVTSLQREVTDIQRQRDDAEREARLLEGVDSFRSTIKTGIENGTFDDRQRICRLIIDRIEISGNDLIVKHVLPAAVNTAQ